MTANKSTGRLPDRKDDIKPKYPNNRVRVSQAGHEEHEDNTPGKERRRWAHKSGTYVEWYENGDSTTFVVGNEQKINKGGLTITVQNNGDIKIGGHARLIVGGGAHVEIQGDAGIAVGGDVLLAAAGNMKMSVNDMYMGVRGDMKMNVAGDTHFQTKGNMVSQVGGNSHESVKGNKSTAAKGTMTSEAQGNHNIKGAQIRHNSSGGGTGDDFNHSEV
jgi:hypothetical protein